MPKALFFNVPAHGHVNPSLPLVTELINRGHQIRYYATSHYQKRVEATGAEFRTYQTVDDDYFDKRGLDGTIPQLAAKTLLETTQQMLPELIAMVEDYQPDYIIYDCMCPWGYYLAKIANLPSVSSFSLMPVSMRGMFDFQTLRIVMPMMIKGFGAGIAASRLGNALGKQYNVNPLDLTTVLNAPGDLSISYSSKLYVPYSDTLPDHFRFIGWSMPDNNVDESFVHESDRPLIYISLGTVANDNFDFFKACIQALAETNYDVLISTGNRIPPEKFGKLPDNITMKLWVPQTQVLNQASLFVTHGGLNSLHDGLYCGLPLLAVPQQTEQTLNAMQIVKIGAGLMLKPHEITTSTIRDCVEKLLSNAQYAKNAEQLRESLQRGGGVSKAVNEINSLLDKPAQSIS